MKTSPVSLKLIKSQRTDSTAEQLGMPDPEDVITERLRGVPLDDWSRADFEEEISAWDRASKDASRKLAMMEWVLAALKPFADTHPDTPMIQLAKMLPEPQRSMALDICHEMEERTPWEKLPFQRVGRKDYHAVVEQAIAELLSGTLGTHKDFTVPTLLNGTGWFNNSSPRERALAEAYAEKLLLASGAFIQIPSINQRENGKEEKHEQ